MDTIRELDVLARFLATQDAQTLAQALLDLAEDHAPVAAFLQRMPLRGGVDSCFQRKDAALGYRPSLHPPG